MKISYYLILALFYENEYKSHGAEPDSACKYYKKIQDLWSSPLILPKDYYAIKKYSKDTINLKWIDKQVEREICLLFTDRVIERLTKPNFDCDEVEKLITYAKLKEETNIVPKAYLIAQGLYYERCLHNKREACDFYSQASKTNYSIKDREILFKHDIEEKWLSKKMNYCRFNIDKILEILKNEICENKNKKKIETYFVEAENEQEQILAPKSYLIAKGLYYEHCKNQRKKACEEFYIKAITTSQTNYDNEILDKYPNLDNAWLKEKQNECILDKKKRKEIRLLQADLDTDIDNFNKKHSDFEKLINDTINYFATHGGLPKPTISIDKTGKNGESMKIVLTTQFEQTTTINRKTKKKDYGLGSYKTQQIDDLIILFMETLTEYIDINDTISSIISMNILSTADGNPIGNDVIYLGDINSNNRIEGEYYPVTEREAKSDVFNNNKNPVQVSIRKGSTISDWELSYLRGRNFYEVALQSIEGKYTLGEVNFYAHDFEDIEKNEKGDYRKVVFSIEIKYIYQNDMNKILNKQKIIDNKIKNLKND